MEAYFFNLGNGQGFSVLEVIKAAERVTGKKVDYSYEEKRPGDPAILVADSTLARRELGWQPKYTNIQEIIETAWHWHQNSKL